MIEALELSLMSLNHTSNPLVTWHQLLVYNFDNPPEPPPTFTVFSSSLNAGLLSNYVPLSSGAEGEEAAAG